MIDIDCVMLAGGKSSRMGQNKALLPFGGFRSLAEFQYDRLKPLFKNVYISVKNREIFDFSANFIEDNPSDVFSPAFAILSSLKSLGKSVFVISVDTPFISEEIMREIFEVYQKSAICVIANSKEKLHTLCAVYTLEAIKPLEEMIQKGDYKLRRLIEQVPHKVVNFSSSKPFFNINRAQDYEEAKSIYQDLR
jgi:molybdopterin-guanine dinucleotide biosynthesis protein A